MDAQTSGRDTHSFRGLKGLKGPDLLVEVTAGTAYDREVRQLLNIVTKWKEL
jgi:hypothetical protein